MISIDIINYIICESSSLKATLVIFIIISHVIFGSILGLNFSSEFKNFLMKESKGVLI